MSENGHDENKLWREYEVCQKAAQSLETIIWQTSGVMGIGLIGTLFLVANRAEKDQPQWWGALVIGLAVFLVSCIWWFIARRWWSIQHSFFIRMRHIEEDLGIYATRYLNYLDNPNFLSESNLAEPRKKELKKRACERKFSFKTHQRRGVQNCLWFLPFFIFCAWILYILLLAFLKKPSP